MPTDFTPVHALIGGTLIGLSATLLHGGLGRIAGISGILNRLFENANDRGWRIAFILSLVAGAALWFAIGDSVPAPRDDFPLAWLVLAGLLVGFGTRLGNGCTSGHGICGLARFSKRSFAAVLVFMGCAALTVYLLRHVYGGIA